MCLAVANSFAAVGSRSFIMLIDGRCNHIQTIKSLDEGWGEILPFLSLKRSEIRMFLGEFQVFDRYQ